MRRKIDLSLQFTVDHYSPTSQLVTEFFKRLKEGESDRAEALRQAQLTVMQQGRDPDGQSADYSSPFCWAAFVLNGEYQGDHE